ncbi:GlsB/YeaQ/YmgE family stress response membrane protein [Staphylococcus simulans]|uniref:GlsB/YeaQ/YmgE family stress response membrane protein n=1 Tax=Staphylococcus simulans TaxID=1286 RepID=UPI00399B2770
MMGLILMIIVGGLIGWLAGAILGKDIPGGILGNIIAGIVGAWLGSSLLGSWGPSLGGIAIFPALIGTILLIVILSLILGAIHKNKRK